MYFIDTGAFLARYVEQDQYHKKALSIWNRLLRDQPICFTSSFVLDETLTLLGRKTNYQFASQRGRILYASEVLQILRPTEEDEQRALDLFEKFADQQVSFTDCVSFVLMHRKKLQSVFSFDHHFERVGFTLLK